MDRIGYASEVAWRLLSIDYRKTLDDILCSPAFAAEFDRLAMEFGPDDPTITPLDYRRAAVSIRKRSHSARADAEKFGEWTQKNRKLPLIGIDDSYDAIDSPGVYVLCAGDVAVFAGESQNMRTRIQETMANEHWQGLEPDSIAYVPLDAGDKLPVKYALKSALAVREKPILNCRLLMHDSELSGQ